MSDVSSNLQRALAELSKRHDLLARDPDAWFFEVTNPLEHDASCSPLTKDLVNMVANTIVEAARH